MNYHKLLLVVSYVRSNLTIITSIVHSKIEIGFSSLEGWQTPSDFQLVFQMLKNKIGN